MTTPVDHRTLERCFHFAGLHGLTVGGPWTHGDIPGIGFVRLERVSWDPRGRLVDCVGLTDEFFFTSKRDPTRCYRGDGRHRSVWRFAQLLAKRIRKVQSELAEMTSAVQSLGLMTAATIKIALAARKRTLAAGPRNVRELAQATGIKWDALKQAMARDAFSPDVAAKICETLPELK